MGVYYGYKPRSYYTPPIVTNGLVAYWDALNTSSYSGSGSSWYDLSGNGYTAALQNSPTFNNDGTGSFTLNGTNQWIDMSAVTYTGFPRYAQAGTISIWFKTSSTAANLSLFGLGNNLTNGMRVNMWISSQTFGCETVNDGISSDFGTFSLNTWYNFTIVIPANSTTSLLKLYVNGVNRTAAYGGTNNWTISIAGAGNGQCCIGTIPGYNLGYFFPGTIALPMVYNRDLGAAEVLQNFNFHKARFGL